jgi:hypothetical protein
MGLLGFHDGIYSLAFSCCSPKHEAGNWGRSSREQRGHFESFDDSFYLLRTGRSEHLDLATHPSLIRLSLAGNPEPYVVISMADTRPAVPGQSHAEFLLGEPSVPQDVLCIV